MVAFTLNGAPVRVDDGADMPLLWFIRERAGLTGTKFGCGVAACGACTVHMDGVAIRSCSTPVAAAEGRAVKTVEGLDSAVEKTVQAVWRDLDVVQCGYCQSGQIMAACALLAANPAPTDADIDTAMDGNLCRCATYHRIRAAIHETARRLKGEPA
ncbi:MAG: (2Fe-2S)-binding protein [Caulobacterales bacterium]|nr:(2Fe-2S)-binding protein [Caulobacterales bacterium]